MELAEVEVKLDLTRYTDNQVAMFFVEGVISRKEFEQWQTQNCPVQTTV